MSGLFKSIGNAFSGVANAIGDAVTGVAKGIGSAVQAAVDDPIGTIAKIAAVATGQLWAIPLISGASTLAHGGSLGDALKSAGVAYVAGAVAGQVTGGLDSAMGTGAAAEGAAANAAPSTFAKILGNAAGNTVAGGNPLNALVTGGIGAGVSELSGQIPGFDTLPAMAQTAIKNAMTSSLSSSLVSGQEPTQANINSALSAGQNAANSQGEAQASTVSPSGTGLPLGIADIVNRGATAQGTTASSPLSSMFTGEKLINGKLATVGPSAAASPLSTVSPIKNVLGNENSNITAPNTMAPNPDVYGMSSMSSLGNVYGMNPSQNGQTPMYANGGGVSYFASGGDSSTESDTSSDWENLLKELGQSGPSVSKQIGMLRLGKMGSEYSSVIPQLANLLKARGMKLAEGGQPEDLQHPNYDGSPVFRTGGLQGLGGKYVEGKGDGTSDDISAMLANGEYVFSADVVSALGNGSNKAGADRLGEMVESIRSRARSSAPNKLPPDAKSPLEYLKPSRGNKHG